MSKAAKEKKRGGGLHEVGHAIIHMSRQESGDTHMHALHMRFLSFQQHAVVFCKTFPSSFPSLCIQDIPLNRAETCLKTDPCFHSVLGERRAGREGRTVQEHGETKLETDAQSSSAQEDKLKGQIIIYVISSCLSDEGPTDLFHGRAERTGTHKKQPLSPWVWNTCYSLKIISDRTTPSRYIWRQEWYKM